MNLKLDNTHLFEVCQEFDWKNPPFAAKEFAQELVVLMKNHNAFGISANQVGYPYRIFAMKGVEENYVFFNPRIVFFGKETVDLEEGCLSFPALISKVTRPNMIRFRFESLDGETRTKDYIGMTARVIQHEVDHLNGICFFNRISKLKFDMMKKRALKRGFNYEKLEYKKAT